MPEGEVGESADDDGAVGDEAGCGAAEGGDEFGEWDREEESEAADGVEEAHLGGCGVEGEGADVVVALVGEEPHGGGEPAEDE